MRHALLLAAALLAGAAEAADRPAVIRGGVAEVGTWRHVLRPGEGGTLAALAPLLDGGIAAAGWVGRDGEPPAAWLVQLDASGTVALDRTYPEFPGSGFLDVAASPEGFIAGGEALGMERVGSRSRQGGPSQRVVFPARLEAFFALLSPEGDVLATPELPTVFPDSPLTAVLWLPSHEYAALQENGHLIVFRDPEDFAHASRDETWFEIDTMRHAEALAWSGDGLLAVGGSGQHMGPSRATWAHFSEAGVATWGKGTQGDGLWYALGGTGLPGGRFALAGWGKWIGLDGEDAALLVVERSGAILFGTTIGGPGPDGFSSIATTPDGGIVAAGWTAEAGGERRDGFVLRLDADFRELWRRTIPGGGDDWFTDLLVAPDGGLILAGRSGGPEGGGWVVRLAPNGQDAEGGPLRP